MTMLMQTLFMEGEKEKITVTEFKRDGYTLWYDTTYFYLLNEDATDNRITVYGRYDEMLKNFAAMVCGEAENPYDYEYERQLHKIILNACGKKIAYK